MPQIFQVLRCYKCLIFQVHQTKKTNKWECKLCGEKQSHKRHYGLGTGKECRLHVQKLNRLHADINEQNNSTGSEEDFESKVEETKENLDYIQSKKKSKWDGYVDKTEPNVVEFSEEECNMVIDNKKVVLEIPKKRKNLNTTDYHNKKTLLKTSRSACDINNYIINAEKEGSNFSTVTTENYKTFNKLENKSATKKSVLKFVSPTINSKWVQFNEQSKGDNEEAVSYDICNTPVINKTELQNSIDESIASTTYETPIPDPTITNIYSKWAKFTEENRSGDNKIVSSLTKNSDGYELNTINSTFKYSNNSPKYLSDKNENVKNLFDNMKKKYCHINI